MLPPVREQSILVHRLKEIYRQQQGKAIAAGELLDYRVEDLVAYVRNNLGSRNCLYCQGPITAENCALAPKNPPERGGSYAFHNLNVVCAGCAAAKSVLDHIEYRELMGLLSSWSPHIRRNLLARLQVGANVRDGLEFLPDPRLLSG